MRKNKIDGKVCIEGIGRKKKRGKVEENKCKRKIMGRLMVNKNNRVKGKIDIKRRMWSDEIEI